MNEAGDRDGIPFAERGEQFFRQLERDLTQEVAEVGGMIVAPGGGWIVDPANVTLGMKVRLATYSMGVDAAGTEAVGFGFEPA